MKADTAAGGENAVLRDAEGAAAGGALNTAIEEHHLLPRQFKEEFKARGLNIEDYTIPLPKAEHTLKPDGIHTGPRMDSWNGQWKQFFDTNRNATKQDILDR